MAVDGKWLPVDLMAWNVVGLARLGSSGWVKRVDR
jgi:hypothetical protein